MIYTLDGHQIGVGDTLHLHRLKNHSLDNKCYWDDRLDEPVKVILIRPETGNVKPSVVVELSGKHQKWQCVPGKNGSVREVLVDQHTYEIPCRQKLPDGSWLAATAESWDYDGIVVYGVNPTVLLKDPTEKERLVSSMRRTL